MCLLTLGAGDIGRFAMTLCQEGLEKAGGAP